MTGPGSRVESLGACPGDTCYVDGSNEFKMKLGMPPPVWGSRGPKNEVLNEQEWRCILEEFDGRYAAGCWPIDQEWEFIHV